MEGWMHAWVEASMDGTSVGACMHMRALSVEQEYPQSPVLSAKLCNCVPGKGMHFAILAKSRILFCIPDMSFINVDVWRRRHEGAARTRVLARQCMVARPQVARPCMVAHSYAAKPP
eukprot:350242-Chlamydomonas_euryale.AAC.8